MVPSLLPIFTLVGIFMCWGSGSPATACAICAMWPMLLEFSLMGYDGANGWERYRSALPFSRRDIVVGRYACIAVSSLAVAAFACLIGLIANAVLPPFVADFEPVTFVQMAGACLVATCVMLILVACLRPFMVKYGYTKGVRYAACFFIVAACLGLALVQQFANAEFLKSIALWIDANAVLLVVTTVLLAIATLAISCAISARIYQRKDI